MKRSLGVRGWWLSLGLLGLSCVEPPDLKDLCYPSDPACGLEDYDGDGVINIEDPFPSDPRCTERTQESCEQCGVSCDVTERCDLVVGECTARDVERCDGEDNDGDGSIDEGVEPPLSDVQAGLCAGALKSCVNGVFVEPTYSELEGYGEERCDGIDSDCDGAIDEGVEPPLSDVQAGLCAGALKSCVNGVFVEPTYSELEGYGEERCDGVDSDCDSTVDEGVEPPLSDVQAGLCAGALKICVNGVFVEPTYSDLEGYGEERCDGIDSDCDGAIDEGLSLYQSRCGEG